MSRIDSRDTLPPGLLSKLQLSAFEPAIRLLHNPPPQVDDHALAERAHPAWERMKFDELLAQQLSLKRAQVARRAKSAAVLPLVGPLCHAFMHTLPFALTAAQQRVLEEIRSDLRAAY